MPCTKRMMATGDWTLNLVPSTPYSLLEQIDVSDEGFSLVYVTDAWIDSSNLSTASMNSLSIFTGIYRRQEGVRLTQLSGPHVSGFLGDEDGKGDMPESFAVHGSTPGTGDLDDWLGYVCPAYITDVSTVTLGQDVEALWHWSNSSPTPRQMFDYLATAFSGLGSGPVNWVVYDDMTMDMAPAVNLGRVGFVMFSDDPGVWQSPGDAAAILIGTVGLPANLGNAIHLENYADRAITVWGSSSSAFGQDADTPHAYKNPGGGTLSWKVLLSMPGAQSATVAGNSTTSIIDADAQPETAPTLTTNVKAIMRGGPTTDAGTMIDKVAPGDTIYVWSPELGLVDTANAVYHRGQLVWPLEVAVQAVTMPIETGMGVYMRRSEEGDIVDLTRYVQFEQPGATIELGPVARPTWTQAFIPRGGVRQL